MLFFFGSRDSFEILKNQLKKYPWIGYRIIYWFSPNEIDYKVKEFKSLDYICNGDINELIKVIKSENLDNLFFCHNANDSIPFKDLLKRLGDLSKLPITYMIDWEVNTISLKKEFFGDIVGLNIWNPGNSILNERIKRFFDLSFASLLLLILAPILIVISFSIKISSKGPIIFSQERYGLNGVSFKMFKFRTMYISNNETNNKIVQATKNDLRITKVGKFLRKYSLDEFPQLINVIKGEMSLVGPRPHAIQHNEYYRKLITGYMKDIQNYLE